MAKGKKTIIKEIKKIDDEILLINGLPKKIYHMLLYLDMLVLEKRHWLIF